MPGWNDLGNALNTLREIDINAIRDESERPFVLACVGSTAMFDGVAALLYLAENRRYGPVGSSPLVHYDSARPLPPEVRKADMLLLVLDGREPLNENQTRLLNELEDTALPLLVLVLHSERPPESAGSRGFALARVVTLANPKASGATDALATALLERLPGELHLAAARRLPGVRACVARNLINSTSFANASYALAAGLPQQIPVLGIPFAAADMLVLTKNQALLVYKLALANGAPPDFQSRIREVLPVLGGAYLWRQMARSLVGLLPVWGLLPKVAIAYAGTYTTGMAAWRWYEGGELVSGAQLKQLSQEALKQGRERAARLIEQARANGQQTPGRLRQFLGKLRPRLPGRQKPALNPPETTPPE